MKIKILILFIIFIITINTVFAQNNELSLNVYTNQNSYRNGDILIFSYILSYSGATIPINVRVYVQFPDNNMVDLTPSLESLSGASYSNIQLPPGYYEGEIFSYTFSEDGNLPAGRYILRAILTDSNNPDVVLVSDEVSLEYPSRCTDSDGGINYYERGTVISPLFTKVDMCVVSPDNNAPRETSSYLSENYCEGDLRRYEHEHCYCEDGACIIGLLSPSDVVQIGGQVVVRVFINNNNLDLSETDYFQLIIMNENNNQITALRLFDDGEHGDDDREDNIYGGILDTSEFSQEIYNLILDVYDINDNLLRRIENIGDLYVFQSLECNSIVLNGDPADKLDITFIGVDYDNNQELFRNDVNRYINYLLSVEPFTSNQNKINFHIINELFAQEDLGCTQQIHPAELSLLPLSYTECNNRLIDSIASICPNDQKIITFGSNNPGWGFIAATARYSASTIFNYYRDNDETTLPHEFGHSFGDLYDERIVFNEYTNDRPQEGLNCDIADTNRACPQWCTGEPISVNELRGIDCTNFLDVLLCRAHDVCSWNNEENRCLNIVDFCTSFTNEEECITNQCRWSLEISPYLETQCTPHTFYNTNIGTNCIEGTGCYQGCVYRNWFRPHRGDLMRGQLGGAEFGPVNLRILENLLENYN